MNLIIGVTGSVAAIKLNSLIREFQAKCPNISIKVICTENSLHFLKDGDIPEKCQKIIDQDEWKAWKRIGDPVMHIELRNWADAIVIAPLDANTMAKICSGICDNLLSCVIRAWNVVEKGNAVFLAPAMNTAMWLHPITADQISKLKNFGYHVIDPIEKTLACGDTGVGAMAHVDQIAGQVLSRMNWK